MSDTLLRAPGAGRQGARAGGSQTAHGTVETPAFMPVGTAGTVKAMLPESVAATGAEILLGNTYHLMLRPGAERVAALGGLHKFMNWPRPDPDRFRRLPGHDPVGAAQDRRGGRRVPLPSRRQQASADAGAQRSRSSDLLDADITMCFDECTPFPATPRAGAQARCGFPCAGPSAAARPFASAPGYRLFGIMQGGIYRRSAPRNRPRRWPAIGFDGYAIGGLAIGEGQQEMFRMLDFAPDLLPADRAALSHGRRQAGGYRRRGHARHRHVRLRACRRAPAAPAQAFTRFGALNCAMPAMPSDAAPLDPAAPARPAAAIRRAYLHHLVKSQEILGSMLLTWHNLHYYQDLMAGLRAAIAAGSLADFAAALPRPSAGAARSRRQASDDREAIYAGPDPARAARRRMPASPDKAVLERVRQPPSADRLSSCASCPEFTSLCPITGQPDFAHLVIDYVPDRWLVEASR